MKVYGYMFNQDSAVRVGPLGDSNSMYDSVAPFMSKGKLNCRAKLINW